MLKRTAINVATNLIQELRLDGIISRTGSNRWSKWLLSKEVNKKMVKERNIDKKSGWNVGYAGNSGLFLSMNEPEKKIIRDRDVGRKRSFSGPIVAPAARLLCWGPKFSPAARELHPEAMKGFKNP